ncbi:Glucose-methanol-choline oxidoreductase,Glucose-methanol-choline oxidoreductase, N-terminal,Glucose- [Cinara cedri]|uniref:Glucose-methanol-choline oxidoreductase,Glucose-methanol-choline oxidoreductase, N-terminal,Glucose n=1 Tax=Cinara cedri TaxID=506608 RepID=A0A5E4NLP7_9HEMI|nr:Glucose-methanol-choline oxidoreductase,Glucose-methanol-choline oxidoreductase, N-terminal,Glucose- [Cinara cedri]
MNTGTSKKTALLWTVAVALSLARPGHGMALTVFQAVVEYYRMLAPEPPDAVPNADRLDRQYDFVVIGAGSGGSVVANRLTEVAGWTVLLVEAGGEENSMTDVPLLVSYLIGTGFDWDYRTEPQAGACGAMVDRKCRWPRGKVMGGTSVINYMMYTRGAPEDYDNWARAGNAGWSYADVLPYFKKSENVDGRLSRSPYHSQGGYLKVQEPAWKTPLGSVFLRAGRELGYDAPVDYNGPRPGGFAYVMATTDRGARCSASKAFLRPIRDRPNLTVSKRSLVTKILIDPETRQAYGVKFVKDQRTTVVYARKEVVLSAGSLNSPQVLMLSGVGPAEHLQAVGVPVVKDLKVGYNLQDHVSMAGLVFLVNQSVTIVESRYRHPKYLVQYALDGDGPYTIPGGAEALAFTATRYATNGSAAADVVPDMELVFGPGALTGDTGGSLHRLFNMREDFYERVYGGFRGRDAWGLVPILLRPRSRGRVMLRSANPFHAPLFYSGYLTDRRDRDVLVEGIKQAITVSKTRAFQKYGSTLLSVPFPGCEHQPFGSDSYWACAVGQLTTNLHHQVGTCKMGPDWDPDAVVDPKLRVRGIKGLRVVDASIMPLIPGGHTNSMAIMIGEKAADMIKETWLN